ncbi:MAG: hypothetical protein KJO70_00170 [Gammaproteobacteria bacterium]|nr:hypothetical protein [Gammaproteobacteria bacterium]
MSRMTLKKALYLAGLSLLSTATMAEPVPVELQKMDDGWQLLRGGEPYFIHGAGGDGPLDELAAAGANSIRTWGGDVGTLLDDAHALGMTVTVGIWLGHERHGFDYNDASQVAAQLEQAREMVLKYKDHPALLMWGVGNEMEGFDDGDNPIVWKAVNDVAAMIKELDPHHPTMTTTAFVHGGRIEFLHNRSPAIDIHGVNAYGGAQAVPRFLRDGDASKPFVLTEFGPVGPWEMPKTDWGAPIEQTSTAKADFYRESYEKSIEASPGMALGAYAFLWGNKVEATETWFGMLLDDGSQTGAVDTMTEIWSGDAPADLAPTVEPLEIAGSGQLEPGQVIDVSTTLADPEGQNLRVEWVLRAESGDYLTGGDYRPAMPDIDGAVVESRADGAQVRMPDDPGAYRLFVYAWDEGGKVATANVPVLVKGDVRVRMPFPVYVDSFENMPWAPTGWMGGVDDLTLDGANTDNPAMGDAAIKIRYEGRLGWAGIAWQHPANDWGDQDGGFNLEGAQALEFLARGAYGGEKVSFGVGLLGNDRAFPDSSTTELKDVVLTDQWQRFVVPLEGKDLSRIKTGFFISLTGRRKPVTIYLDTIRFISDD